VQAGGSADRRGEDVTAVTGKPAPASARAIEARVHEVVLVTTASGTSAVRSRRSAATAPGSGLHETVSTPSMSISTARICRMRRP
jgi:hypothetical protein